MLKVVAAIILQNNKVYVCQRPNKGSLPNFWEFPGGKVEKGETEQEALIREMQEECGVDVRVNDLLDRTIYHYPDFSLELICYYAEVISGELKSIIHQDEKFIEVEKLNEVDFAAADLSAVKKLTNKS